MRARTRTACARLGAVAVIACVGLLPSGTVRAAISTLSPVADSFVRADQTGTNWGTSSGIRADGSPIANAYLRFSVSVPPGEIVTKATLKVFTTQSSESGFTVHGVTDNSWGETTLNYGNAPVIGSQIAASGSYNGNAYISVDVTPLVTGSGDVSMALKRSSTSSNTYNSREAASNRPQFSIESAPAPPAPWGETVVYALGDGADGSTTSRLLADYVKAQDPDRFFYLGDVYETGTASEFSNNYEPLYGSMASKTDPVIGNHEYGNRGVGYYQYWQNKRGWTQEQAKHRSYVDAASGWQIIAYSSETEMAAEGAWVAAEIAKHAGTCRLVMAHKGRHVVADTAHTDNTSQESVWANIVNRTAINLVGHNHLYGRLAPLDGVTVFVSGAGGHGLRSLGTQHHTVAASKTGIATATRFVLRPGAASFSQVDKDGTVYDAGSISCTPETEESFTFRSIADARVQENAPNVNYATYKTLIADGGSDPDIESYLRFAVSGLPGPVTSAKLRLYATNGTVDGPAVYATGSTWGENTITWNTRPARTSGPQDDKGAIAVNSWVEYDVTALVTGDGTFSFVLATSSTDDLQAPSREGLQPPELVITTS